eukprot:scaffold316327_cov28-Prasinocladus_malaysianus.AAC.1
MLAVTQTCQYVPQSPFVASVIGKSIASSPYLTQVSDAITGDCDSVTGLVSNFNLNQCLDISLATQPGFVCILVSCILAYVALLLLAYPSSIEIYGKDFFELPVCVERDGWCCCSCCSGSFGSDSESVVNSGDDILSPPVLHEVTITDTTGVIPPQSSATEDM